MSITLNTITNPDRLALINSNFSKIAQAINESLLWRNGNTAGETLLTRDVDFNSNQILNAYVGEYALSDVVGTANGAQEAADEAAQSAASAAASATIAQNVSLKIVFATDYGADKTGILDSAPAIQSAVNAASSLGFTEVHVEAGKYRMNSGVDIPPGVHLVGAGIDYWDTFRPDPTRLLKSDSKGTHFYFTGTGLKTKSCINLSNARSAKTVGGVVFPFTHFTNQDSTAGASATARNFSCGFTLQRGSGLHNCRVVPNFNGLAGYNDASTSGLGDEWDVGVWVYDGSDAIVNNVQSVGYWRMAGFLLTENNGTYTLKGNPERSKFVKCLGQGVRGLIARNSPTIDVSSNTANTITVVYDNTFTLTSQNSFRLTGSSSLYTFSGYSVAGGLITLTGVSPALVGTVSNMRAPNIGNNFSGTVFSDCVFFGLEHTNGAASDTLGLPVAGAAEFDGFPMRNLKFRNTKFQTIYDKLNTLFGGCSDFKLSDCEFENGVLIAYSNTETQGYTGNIRMDNTDIQSSVDFTAFTPRGAWIPYKSFNTQLTTNEFIVKPWNNVNALYQYANGTTGIKLSTSDSNLEAYNGAGALVLRNQGGSGATELRGVNVNFTYTDATSILQLFGASKNASFSGAIVPATDNARIIGSTSLRFATASVVRYFIGAGLVSINSGTGSPEGVVTAVVGSTYQRSDGAAGTCFYVKETGTGNTGWVAK